MSIYLGNLGRLVELKGPSSQSVAADDGYTFKTTLEGRVKARARSARPRQWSVDIGAATPADIANLLAFAGGEWGNGPFVWVSVDAPVTNLLTPEVARCGPQAVFSSSVSRSGPMALGDGQWSGASLTTSDPGGTLWVGASKAPVPVIPGQPVTASAYVIGAGAKVRLHWVAADGSAMSGTVVSSPSGTAGAPKRLHATGVPPAGAVSCTLSTTGAPQITRPAITWTSTLFDWHPGEGCQKAVIHGLSRNVILALREPAYGRYSNASFTITEVG